MIKFVEPREEFPNIPPCLCIPSTHPDFENYQTCLMDESRLADGNADMICFPNSEMQLADLLIQAHQNNTPVTVSAGRTGITGGAVPFSGMLISLENMNQILNVHKNEKSGEWMLTCQPGINLDQINDFLLSPDSISIKNPAIDATFLKEAPDWFYPPDPTEKTAHLGGTVATNASGAHSFLYGPTRAFIHTLRIVLMDGSVLNLKRGEHIAKRGEAFQIQTRSGTINIPVPSYAYPQIKNTAGYYTSGELDLIDLFIGSEGTLGIFSKIEIVLCKRPEMILGCLAFFPEDSLAYQFVRQTKDKISDKSSLINPSALEYFGPNALNLLRKKRQEDGPSSAIPELPEKAVAAIYFEQELTEDLMDDVYLEYDELLQSCNVSMDETWAALDAKELKQMAVFRHQVPESINTLIGQRQREIPELHKISTDFVVPEGKLNAFMQTMRNELNDKMLDYAIFGHIGDNHLHVNIIPKNREELALAKKIYFEYARKAVETGGTISGEHGIGKIKKQMMHEIYSDSDMNEMKSIKKRFDSKCLLNPDVLF